MAKYKKAELMSDFRKFIGVANGLYSISKDDIFAIGYLCGKYNLKKLYNNQNEVIEACREYDETDDLELFDTIGETLIDLKVISNEKGIL